jgi:nucleotide-binding universal stress UspA family protein
MNAFRTDWDLEPSAGTSGGGAGKPLVVVVGFDGSQPARRALDRAANLLRLREGQLEVVFIAHLPAGAELSAEAFVQVQQSFDKQTESLAAEVGARLEGLEQPWHFQRRDGTVAAQLQAAASEIDRRYHGEADVVIVAGGSSHWYHRLAGSVGSTLARRDRFPVIVVP